jgi:hypothetical protein
MIAARAGPLRLSRRHPCIRGLRLLPTTEREKDVEILALRHQLTVLQRQLGDQRLQLRPEDRAILAARGLTFHGLRHSHKTWLIADKIPDIAQAKRLGHHLSDRLAEVYSHVAPEIEAELLKTLERRWYYAHQTRRPVDNRPHRKPTTPRSAARAPHSAPALRTTGATRRQQAQPQLTAPRTVHSARQQEGKVLPNSSTPVHNDDHRPHRITLKELIQKALRPGTTPDSKGLIKKWS